MIQNYDNSSINIIFCTICLNSVDPDQTAPLGAVWSGSTLFVCMQQLVLHAADDFSRQHFQMRFFRSRKMAMIGQCLTQYLAYQGWGHPVHNIYRFPPPPPPPPFFMPPKELWEAYSNRTVRPSISPSVRPSVSPSVPLSCPVHISYILWGRNSKFGVWIHLGMAECRVPFSGHCDLDLDLWPSF